MKPPKLKTEISLIKKATSAELIYLLTTFKVAYQIAI